jgi:hypothetical protein
MASAPMFLQDGVPSGIHMALQNHMNTLCLEMDQLGRSQRCCVVQMDAKITRLSSMQLLVWVVTKNTQCLYWVCQSWGSDSQMLYLPSLGTLGYIGLSSQHLPCDLLSTYWISEVCASLWEFLCQFMYVLNSKYAIFVFWIILELYSPFLLTLSVIFKRSLGLCITKS